jgi:hypothetical protein
VPCYTTSPHGLIPPPTKRARTLVSSVVVTVISIKIYCINTVIPVVTKLVDAKPVAGWGRILPENSHFPTSSRLGIESSRSVSSYLGTGEYILNVR